MPLYYFTLKCGRDVIADKEGVELPEAAAARQYATAVARDLMRHRELSSRKWRLEVYDDYLEPSFEILFAEVDQTMDHLEPRYREPIELIARLAGALDDAFINVRASLGEVHTTLAQADRIIAAVKSGGARPLPRSADP